MRIIYRVSYRSVQASLTINSPILKQKPMIPSKTCCLAHLTPTLCVKNIGLFFTKVVQIEWGRFVVAGFHGAIIVGDPKKKNMVVCCYAASTLKEWLQFLSPVLSAP